MKRLAFMLIGFLVLSNGYAKRISEQEASDVARQFMQGKNIKTKPRLVKGMKETPSLKNYYLFNFEDNGGFVIVSGDDRTTSILGYADQGEIDPNNIPVSFQWLLDYYDSQLASLASNKGTSLKEMNKVATGNKNNIEPFIMTQWGQGEPYNLNCPNIQGQRSATGCVATAMAQVINYHRWPQDKISGIAGYTTSTNKISMPELPAISLDWNNINDVAISRLMLYCGQSVQMDYDPYGSSAVAAFVPEALTNVFGYSKSATHLRRSDYSDDEWDNLVYNQISDGLPVLYFGQSPTAGGHAFIVDGYEFGKYHINWGWDGICDGFFTLDRLDPFSDNGFTNDQEITINVYPPSESADDNRPKAIIKYFDCNERIIDRTSANANFNTFQLQAAIQNDLANDISLELGLALYDDNGLVKILAQNSHDFSGNELFEMNSEISISADIDQGEYRIVSVSRSDSAKDWIANAGSVTTYVKVTIEESSLQLNIFPLSEADKHEIEYGIHTIDGITYRLRSEYETLHAYPQRYEGEGQYSGDIYIPDFVIYQNMRFDTFYNGSTYDNGIFDSNDEIISISTPIAIPITNCANLKSITFRDKCTITSKVNNCQSLETIIFSDFCNTIAAINNCPLIKSLSFYTRSKVIITAPDGGSLWNHETMPSLTDVYFNGDIPPTFHWWYPDPTPEEAITIHIPQGTLETYKYGGWSKWNLKEDLGSLPISTKWDYCGDYVFTGSYGGFGFGCGSNNAEYAMRIPGDHLNAYKNCKITAIEYVAGTSKDHEIEYVFVTSPGIDYVVKEPVKTPQGTWMRVELTTPYTITGEDVFVGAGRHHSVAGVFTSDEESVEDGLWGRNMGSDNSPLLFAPAGTWYKNVGQSGWNRPVAIRAIIEGESLPNDIVILSTNISSDSKPSLSPKDSSNSNSSKFMSNIEDEKYFVRNIDMADNDGGINKASAVSSSKLTKVASTKDKMIIKIRNRSPQVVKNITFDWDIDGIAQQPINIETGLPNNYEEEFIVELPDDISGRYHSIKVNVLDIDGKPDEISANSEMVEVIVSSPSTYFPRKYVMEEATGTWCGYCPLASATIEKMKALYPDNFISIAIHDDDMGVKNESYDTFKNAVEAYPSALINRTNWLSNWGPFDLEEKKDKGEAMIKASASFGENLSVNVSTQTEFGFSDTGNDCYRIAYVVLEDNVGPHIQNNYYSNLDSPDNPDDYMNWWVHQNSIVMTTFNDVARGIYDYNGIQGLFPDNIVEGEKYKSEYSFALPSGIKDASNLKIVTLLIDTMTGEIMNADCTHIDGEVPDINAPIPVESIAINLSSAEMKVGDILSLTATVLPKDATDKTVQWTSDNESVATVDKYGRVIAVGLGMATITAKSGEANASCVVSVIKTLVETVILSPDNWSGEEGESFKIEANVLPEDASDKTLIWTSSDESVATVDVDGYVSLLKGGSCVITASTADGSGVSAECLITSVAGVDGVFSAEESFDIYSFDGMLIKKDADREDLKMMIPGIYLLRQGNNVNKVVIR